MTEAKSGNKAILVIGGGISGITAAVEAAEVGHPVILVEKRPYLGGRVAQLSQYFPKLCPPYCGLEINFKRIKNNPRLTYMPLTEVESIAGTEGDFQVTLRSTPRFVNERCTACGKCTEVCPVERPDEFNYGLGTTKAIYLPHSMAFPMMYAIDGSVCEGKSCAKCVEVCSYNAIDLDMEAETKEIEAAAIVVATGWEPYNAEQIDYYGFGKHSNVINNVQMERLAAANGPTEGKILRPSDNKEVRSIAFVQCAGSRDENYLPFCSTVCCMASLKQSSYVREQYPEAKIHIFYIDIRSPGRLEDFYQKIQGDPEVVLTKGKVARIEEEPQSRDLIVEAEDIAAGGISKVRVDMVVLATGMPSAIRHTPFPHNVTKDEDGFAAVGPQVEGIYATGCARKPMDVSSSVKDATGAALKAIQSLVRR
jgi:quinone-modifying oxidoreductase subunit QmoA